MKYHNSLLVGGLMLLGTLWSACNQMSNSSINDCPPCPNNTTCQDGDCGCDPDQFDMGSWCLRKHENLFVAASLDCPCMDAVGLYLEQIEPEPGNGSYPLSSYDLVGRGKNNWASVNKFSYYQRPDGDSIVIYNAVIPGTPGYYACGVQDTLNCEIDLFGKFHGPDTIQTRVVYTRCRNKANVAVNYKEIKQLTFVRKR
jgi:hypothetical protein